MSTPVIWVLRLIHIITGVFWVGGVVMFARFLFPAVRAVGPAAGPVMDHLNRVRQLPRALLSAGVLNILAGIGLYAHDSSGFQMAWVTSGPGLVFGAGGLLAIAALLVGVFVNAPTAKRMGELAETIRAAGGPPSPAQAAEMQRLQARLGTALEVVAGLLPLATAAMAVARYTS